MIDKYGKTMIVVNTIFLRAALFVALIAAIGAAVFWMLELEEIGEREFFLNSSLLVKLIIVNGFWEVIKTIIPNKA